MNVLIPLITLGIVCFGFALLQLLKPSHETTEEKETADESLTVEIVEQTDPTLAEELSNNRSTTFVSVFGWQQGRYVTMTSQHIFFQVTLRCRCTVCDKRIEFVQSTLRKKNIVFEYKVFNGREYVVLKRSSQEDPLETLSNALNLTVTPRNC